MGQAGLGRCRGLTFFGPAPAELGLSSRWLVLWSKEWLMPPDG